MCVCLQTFNAGENCKQLAGRAKRGGSDAFMELHRLSRL